MLKENWRFIARIERLADLLITVVAFFLAYYCREMLGGLHSVFGLTTPFGGRSLAPLEDYLVVLLVAVIGLSVYLSAVGAYGSMRLRSFWQLTRAFGLCAMVVFFSLASALFVLKIDLSRSFIGLFCALLFVFLIIERFVVLWILRGLRRRGFNFRSVLICGTGRQALRIAREVARRPELGIRIRGFAALSETGLEESEIESFRELVKQSRGLQVGRILKGVDEAIGALSIYAIDEVLFTDCIPAMREVEQVALACAEQGVSTTLVADLFSMGMVKSGLSYFGDIPLIHFQAPPGDRWDLGVKRAIDVAGSFALLMLFLPLMIAIALLVSLSSRGSIFFTQTRVGLNGRLFNVYKFRSMRIGSEHELSTLQEKNEMSGPAFKLKDDPRITPVGKMLRRFSLDELPQLWNVLRGDMSLVGPRPPVPGEVNRYKRKYRRRLSMRPGLTCTWQVSGRNEISDFDTWVGLDLEYIDNWSLGRDFWLLFKTVPAVLRGTGH
jgi:exopolysaccharide biosynthesis polyprenyl glycosylphosphotransferase